jgi:hypothetical protein
MTERTILDLMSGEAWARSEDRDTSKEAAEAVRGDVATKLEQEVLDGLRRLNGSGTAREVAAITGMDLQSVTPRFMPLARKGLVEATGERRSMVLPDGRTSRPGVVWRLAEERRSEGS